jgi:hypothetical protein
VSFTVFLSLLLVTFACIGFVLAIVMGRLGYSSFTWGALGLVLGPIALLLALLSVRSGRPSAARCSGRSPTPAGSPKPRCPAWRTRSGRPRASPTRASPVPSSPPRWWWRAAPRSGRGCGGCGPPTSAASSPGWRPRSPWPRPWRWPAPGRSSSWSTGRAGLRRHPPAYGSIFWTLTGFLAVVAAGGLIMVALALHWAVRGQYTARRHANVANVARFWWGRAAWPPAARSAR